MSTEEKIQACREYIGNKELSNDVVNEHLRRIVWQDIRLSEEEMFLWMSDFEYADTNNNLDDLNRLVETGKRDASS